jgi:hypothetical protein
MFVDRIIQNFENQMVQTSLIRIPDEHARPFPDRLQAFQFVDLRGVVFLRRTDSGRAVSNQFVGWNFVLSS